MIMDGVQGFMGRYTEENIWKACLKETKAVWRTEHSFKAYGEMRSTNRISSMELKVLGFGKQD